MMFATQKTRGNERRRAGMPGAAAGGAGDVTWTLTEILKRPEFRSESGPGLIYASIPGPDLVRDRPEFLFRGASAPRRSR